MPVSSKVGSRVEEHMLDWGGVAITHQHVLGHLDALGEHGDGGGSSASRWQAQAAGGLRGCRRSCPGEPSVGVAVDQRGGLPLYGSPRRPLRSRLRSPSAGRACLSALLRAQAPHRHHPRCTRGAAHSRARAPSRAPRRSRRHRAIRRRFGRPWTDGSELIRKLGGTSRALPRCVLGTRATAGLSGYAHNGEARRCAYLPLTPCPLQ